MAKVIKETVVRTGGDATQNEVAQVEVKATGIQTLTYLIYFMFGIFETLLVTRFILKLFGANTQNSFVDVVYSISGVLVAPFAGIFSSEVSQGLETASVFEPATIIAIIVYIAIALGTVKLVEIVSGRVQAE